MADKKIMDTGKPQAFSLLKTEYLIGICLAGMILIAYGQVSSFDFVNYDDNLYVTQNPQTKAGLTVSGIAWAFTTGAASNWHPLTWVSHMTDVSLFGERAGAHHLVNVAFHLLNTLLLFWILRRITGNLWPSAFVAALFAIHPLHVESVAWIAERKDVLSTLFWLLAMAAYAAYAKRPSIGRYALVMVLLALGLMAKPMLVTLPAVLVLLDIWPLKRYTTGKSVAAQAARLCAEKIPLIALAAASSVVTFLAQQRGHSVAAMDVLPVPLRFENAVVAYGRYMLMTVWPRGLAVFYPHPGAGLPSWHIITAVMALLVISIIVALLARRFPYLLVGWLWYLGTLVPVIGIVQVGSQALADRYTYVPMIGLLIMAAWGIADLTAKLRVPKPVVACAAGATIAVLMVCTWSQVSCWRNSITLMEHAIQVTTGNYLAHKNLGVAFASEKRYPEAVNQYVKGIQVKPNDPDLYYNLGNALNDMGKPADAVAQYRKALQVNPDHAETHYNLGNALAKQEQFDAAIVEYRETIRIQPAHLGAIINLGNALAVTRHPAEAAAQYLEALKIEPDNQEALGNLGNALAEQDKLDEAVYYYRRAIAVDATHPDTFGNLGYALVKQNKLEEAAQAFAEVVRLDPKNVRAREQLKQLEASLGRPPTLGGR